MMNCGKYIGIYVCSVFPGKLISDLRQACFYGITWACYIFQAIRNLNLEANSYSQRAYITASSIRRESSVAVGSVIFISLSQSMDPDFFKSTTVPDVPKKLVSANTQMADESTYRQLKRHFRK